MKKYACFLAVFFIAVYCRPQARTFPTISRTKQEMVSYWSKWEFCVSQDDQSYFINGISVIFGEISRNFSRSRSFFPVIGFNISCISHLPYNPDISFALSPLLASNSTIVNSREIDICEETESEFFGWVVGTEKRHAVNINATNSKRLIDLAYFCNNADRLKKTQIINRNIAARGHNWGTPNFCPWGEYVCGIKIQYDINSLEVMDFQTKCSKRFDLDIRWQNYRGSTDGIVLSSKSAFSEEEAYHSQRPSLYFIKELDNPYYKDWEFCPVTTYMTGIQAQTIHQQLRFFCSEISKPNPRPKHSIQKEEEIWEWDDELSTPVECQGVVIGIQILYAVFANGENEIQGIRLFCSFSEDKKTLSYIKAILPPKNTSSQFVWGDAQMCKRQQAVCGYNNKLNKNKNNLEQIKFKCCNVPSTAEICAPYDNFELVVECDAWGAMAATTCQYTQTEGLTHTFTRSASTSRDENLRQSLNKEWSLTEGKLIRDTEEINHGISNSLSIGDSTTQTDTGSQSKTDSNSIALSTSNTKGSTQTNNQGKMISINKESSLATGNDKTKTNSESDNFSNTLGETEGWSNTNVQSSSKNYLRTSNTGNSFTDTEADTIGTSSGSVSAKTIGENSSKSKGTTLSYSQSSSSTSGESSSFGASGSVTAGGSFSVGAEGGFSGFGVSASVKTNFESHFSATAGINSESSKQSSSINGNENSKSENELNNSEQSLQNMNQRSDERTNSNSKATGKESNFNNGIQIGGDFSDSNTDMRNIDKSNQETQGSQIENSESQTNKETREQSIAVNHQNSSDSSTSSNNQQTNDNSKTSQKSNTLELSRINSIVTNRERSEQESINLSQGLTREGSNSRTGTKGQTHDKSFSTGFDWSHTSGHTWTQEKSYQVTMTVPAGYKTKLFQVVGYCGNFQVRTNNFKRMDQLADWALEFRQSSIVNEVEN